MGLVGLELPRKKDGITIRRENAIQIINLIAKQDYALAMTYVCSG